MLGKDTKLLWHVESLPLLVNAFVRPVNAFVFSSNAVVMQNDRITKEDQIQLNQMQVAQGQGLARDCALVQAAIGYCILLLLVRRPLPSTTCTNRVFMPSTNIKTSCALAVGITCNLRQWPVVFLYQLAH